MKNVIFVDFLAFLHRKQKIICRS